LIGLHGDSPGPPGRLAATACWHAGMIAVAVPVYSIVAATYEEVAFRACLISRLSLWLGRRGVWSVIVAGAVFALMHGYGPRSTFMVFMASIAYGSVYVGSRSLPRLVLAHWLHNLAIMQQYL